MYTLGMFTVMTQKLIFALQTTTAARDIFKAVSDFF
jgi:hypothetical protein